MNQLKNFSLFLSVRTWCTFSRPIILFYMLFCHSCSWMDFVVSKHQTEIDDSNASKHKKAKNVSTTNSIIIIECVPTKVDPYKNWLKYWVYDELFRNSSNSTSKSIQLIYLLFKSTTKKYAISFYNFYSVRSIYASSFPSFISQVSFSNLPEKNIHLKYCLFWHLEIQHSNF